MQAQPQTAPRFRLLRHFAIVGLLGMVVTTASLAFILYGTNRDRVARMGQTSNVQLTRILANSLWDRVASLVNDSAGLPAAAIRGNPGIAPIDAAIRTLAAGTTVSKVKIYSLEGMTVYSSETAQIGEDKRANAGFVSARAGSPASEVVERDRFSSFEGIVERRGFVASYIPVRDPKTDAVVAVFEVYDDVTGLLAEARHSQIQTVSIVLAALLALYLGLILVVRRVARTIDRHEHARERHETALRNARDLLESRVQERTAQLEHTLAELRGEVSERRRFAEALEEAKAAAETASTAKSQFLARMSHEIRTPMNGVLGLLQLLENERLPPHQAKLASTARASAGALMGILNDILDFSRIEAGELRLERLEFSLHSLAGQTRSLFQHSASERGLVFETVVDPGVPDMVVGDPLRVGQIINNLVSNAIKFTQRGRVCLHISAPGRLSDTATIPVRIAVSDTGIGIDPDAAARLFAPFVQADDSITRWYGGTGLGLAISRELAQLMGGQLTLASEPGRGSTFVVDLRLLVAEGVTAGAAAGPDEAVPSFVATVLLVEDNAVNRLVAEGMLASLGCEVLTAGNGVEATRMFESATFDLVLMDIHMPEMDGQEATRRIRAGNRVNSLTVPIVALTASALAEDRERCLDSGMNDLLAKPFSRSELARVLARYLPAGPTRPRVVAAAS